MKLDNNNDVSVDFQAVFIINTLPHVCGGLTGCVNSVIFFFFNVLVLLNCKNLPELPFLTCRSKSRTSREGFTYFYLGSL